MRLWLVRLLYMKDESMLTVTFLSICFVLAIIALGVMAHLWHNKGYEIAWWFFFINVIIICGLGEEIYRILKEIEHLP